MDNELRIEQNELHIENFCGVDIFNWKEWDIVDTDVLCFYSVEFLLPSMQKYSGMDVEKCFDGHMEIYKSSDPEAAASIVDTVWSGYITDIPEVMEVLNKRQRK